MDGCMSTSVQTVTYDVRFVWKAAWFRLACLPDCQPYDNSYIFIVVLPLT